MKKRILIFMLNLYLITGLSSADSLWREAEISKGGDSLYTDDKASRVGDIVTILVVESVNVAQNTDTSTSKKSDLKAEVKSWAGLNIYHGPKAIPVKFLPTWDIATSKKFSGGGTYKGNYIIKAQITTKVIEVLPNGNLVIEGQTQARINDEINTVAISGIVRPQDIGPDNTVLSTKIADAKVWVVGKGPLNSSTKKGILRKIIDWIWPF